MNSFNSEVCCNLRRMWNELFLICTENTLYNAKCNKLALWVGLTVVASTGYILWSRKRKNLPPGPIGLPIFGYYFFLRKKPLEKLAELARKYGNVFGLYIGSKYIVFLNDWEAVKDGLSQISTLSRPPSLFDKVPFNFGIAGVNGEEWVETRRLASKIMKDGLEKNQWEDLIEKELFVTSKRIAEMGGNHFEVRSFFCESFSNNVISLLLGDRLEEGHPITKMVTRSVDFIMENTQSLQLSNFSELLPMFLRTLRLEKILPFAEETDEFLKFISNAVDSNINDSKSEIRDSFITRYQKEIDCRRKAKLKTYASEDSLKGSLLALMVGANETTRTTIIWTLIAMADHPDKQRKVHEELDRVVGKERSVRWSDRRNVPYTLAALLESMRWKVPVPIPALRMTTEDTRIQGYTIPKETFVATNVGVLHYDLRYWEHPDQYIPERFLLEDGRKVNMAPESFMPFSFGKRNCPGKLLALMDMLQYFSTLMQRFKVLPKEGDKVKYDAFLGLSYQARNIEMRFIPR